MPDRTKNRSKGILHPWHWGSVSQTLMIGLFCSCGGVLYSEGKKNHQTVILEIRFLLSFKWEDEGGAAQMASCPSISVS